MDNGDGNRKIDKQEFYFGLKEQGVDILKREAEALLDFLDTNDDGYVDFNEFLYGIRGKPDMKR